MGYRGTRDTFVVYKIRYGLQSCHGIRGWNRVNALRNTGCGVRDVRCVKWLDFLTGYRIHNPHRTPKYPFLMKSIKMQCRIKLIIFHFSIAYMIDIPTRNWIIGQLHIFYQQSTLRPYQKILFSRTSAHRFWRAHLEKF